MMLSAWSSSTVRISQHFAKGIAGPFVQYYIKWSVTQTWKLIASWIRWRGAFLFILGWIFMNCLMLSVVGIGGLKRQRFIHICLHITEKMSSGIDISVRHNILTVGNLKYNSLSKGNWYDWKKNDTIVVSMTRSAIKNNLSFYQIGAIV